MANYFGAFPAKYFGGGYWRGGEAGDTLAAVILASSSLTATASIQQPIRIVGDD